jgi:hypothetical protein
VVIAATFADTELTMVLTQNAEGAMARVTLTADYAITKEGVVHGVITGLDVDVKSTTPGSRMNCALATMDGMAELQKFVDCPFSFRVKSTAAGMMVSNLKLAVEGVSAKDLAIGCGMFRQAVDGKIPVPEAIPARVLSRCEAPSAVPSSCTPAWSTGSASVYGNRVPAGVMPPGATVPGWSPTRPANVPASDFGMMAEVFGQMMGTPSANYRQAAPTMLPPYSIQPAGLVVPVPAYLQPAPAPAPSLPPPPPVISPGVPPMMPVPTPPVIDEARGKKKGKKKKSSSEPNAPRAPTHLTPERIHGGIY